jgi:hypothetical protein
MEMKDGRKPAAAFALPQNFSKHKRLGGHVHPASGPETALAAKKRRKGRFAYDVSVLAEARPLADDAVN